MAERRERWGCWIIPATVMSRRVMPKPMMVPMTMRTWGKRSCTAEASMDSRGVVDFRTGEHRFGIFAKGDVVETGIGAAGPPHPLARGITHAGARDDRGEEARFGLVGNGQHGQEIGRGIDIGDRDG